MSAALFAAAIAAGAHPAIVAIAALAIFEPRVLIAGAAAWSFYGFLQRRKQAKHDEEAAFLRALAAELRAGTSLRLAVVGAAQRSPLGLERAARLAGAGMPMERIAPLLREALDHNGVAAAAALELSAWSGARTAAVFEGLADRAAEAAELRHEQRAATTQARLSAWVVGLAPLAFTALLLAGGSAGLRGAGGLGAGVIALGVALELAGLAVVAALLRSAAR